MDDLGDWAEPDQAAAQSSRFGASDPRQVEPRPEIAADEGLIAPAGQTVRVRRTCIIVSGMHRSGTSAIARFVSFLGADLPKNLVPPKADNARGFWEPSAVVRAHDKLLAALGTSSADPLPFPSGWRDSGPAQDAQRELADIIRREFSGSRTFVVKDPRVARILPLWLKLLDDMDIDAAVIVPYRNPLDVAASLKKRDRMSLATSLLLYVDSYLNTEFESRGRRRCFVSYDDVLRDWRSVSRTFAAVFGEELLGGRPNCAFDIDRYLSASLRHHRHSRDDLIGATDVPPIVVDLFDLLTEATASGDEARLQRSFDDVRETVNRATALFRPVIVDERVRAREREREFEGSRSWRVTAPLRWINRYVGGGAA